jgi:hypothetical protein
MDDESSRSIVNPQRRRPKRDLQMTGRITWDEETGVLIRRA